MFRDAINRQNPTKRLRSLKIQLRMALKELQRELKARTAPADHQLPSGGGAGGCCARGLSSDDQDDDEDKGDDA